MQKVLQYRPLFLYGLAAQIGLLLVGVGSQPAIADCGVYECRTTGLSECASSSCSPRSIAPSQDLEKTISTFVYDLIGDVDPSWEQPSDNNTSAGSQRQEQRQEQAGNNGSQRQEQRQEQTHETRVVSTPTSHSSSSTSSTSTSTSSGASSRTSRSSGPSYRIIYRVY